jgi:hypothetical protein
LSKKVRDLRLRLEALAKADGAHSDDAVSILLAILADFDDMNIEAFFRRLGGKSRNPTAPAPMSGGDVVSRLKSAFPNDDAFHNAITEIAAQKSATKPLLTQAYYDLFNRTRGVPKKATRADILRLIEDERNIAVRDAKMGRMLGRRVPAE